MRNDESKARKCRRLLGYPGVCDSRGIIFFGAWVFVYCVGTAVFVHEAIAFIGADRKYTYHTAYTAHFQHRRANEQRVTRRE